MIFGVLFVNYLQVINNISDSFRVCLPLPQSGQLKLFGETRTYIKKFPLLFEGGETLLYRFSFIP